MCSDRFQIRGYMVDFFFQLLLRRELKCSYVAGHNVLSFYFFPFFFLTTSTHVNPSSAIEGRWLLRKLPSIAVHTLAHIHTCTHCHVTPRVNLFTCTSVHWSVWKPKLHLFPLASDPCGLTLLFSYFSIYFVDGIM